MRKWMTVLLLGFLFLAPAGAQVDSAAVQGVVQVSRQFRGQIDGNQADVKWTGLGLVSGDMVDMQLTNTSNSPQTFRFIPGMVLQDPGKRVQPVMLEENLSFTLQPGETVKRRMRGYCLDYSKEPPATGNQEDYQVATDLSEYERAVSVLYHGLELDKEKKLKPVLRPLVHRTVVIQRAIWASLGGENPGTKEDLQKDLEDEIRYRSSVFPEGQMDCLSSRIWSDVQQVLDSGK